MTKRFIQHSELTNYKLEKHKNFMKSQFFTGVAEFRSLHANVNIMPAHFTLLQEEIEKLLGNAKEVVSITYLCFPV